MITYILIGLAVLLVLFLVAASLQSPELRVERSVTMAAPATLPFSWIDDVRKWQEMSPYVKYDPAARMTFEGPPAGVGASFAWSGNAKVGAGRMTITDSRPNELIRFKLEFLKPWACTNTAEFTFRESAGRTEVKWTMHGHKNFISKAMSLVMNMDKMIGRDFEAGLATLRDLSEAAAQNAGAAR